MGATGDPLPVVFRSLETKKIQLRRGQFTLVCAGPGTGKSIFTLTYALKARVPTFYFSADSDPFTQYVRTLCVVGGVDEPTAVRLAKAPGLSEVERKLAALPIRFNYSASPTLSELELSLEAFSEVFDGPPALVVVDNVTNVQSGMGGDDGDPFSGLEGLMDYLHDMARKTEAAVIGLHHVTGGFNDGEKPIPLSGVKGQITRVPEMVLTLHKQKGDDHNPEIIGVSAVKNRGGKADASGNTFAELEFIGDKYLIRDPERPISAAGPY
ncbi:AAA family ATPase [Amycolatopsis sp. NPDC003731]